MKEKNILTAVGGQCCLESYIGFYRMFALGGLLTESLGLIRDRLAPLIPVSFFFSLFKICNGAMGVTWVSH